MATEVARRWATVYHELSTPNFYLSLESAAFEPVCGTAANTRRNRASACPYKGGPLAAAALVGAEVEIKPSLSRRFLLPNKE